MEFYRLRDVPAEPPAAVFRASRAWPALAALGAFAAAGIPLVVIHGAPLHIRWCGWISEAVVALGGVFFAGDFMKTLRPSNWIARAGPRGLLVKFRSWRNAHLPDDTPGAVFLAAAEIEGIAKAVLPAASGRTAETFLDIVLVQGDRAELARRLEEERRKEDPIEKAVRWRDLHDPVRLFDGRVLRIEWRTRHTRIAPGIDEAIEVLGRFVPVRPPWDGPGEETVGDLPVDPADEARLRVLARLGSTVEAVRLARRVHGLPLVEAKRLVDDLRAGKDGPDAP